MPRHPQIAQDADVLPPPENRLIGTRRLASPDVIDRAVVTVNHAEQPLAWLARRGHISGVQLLAAERLRDDFHRAQLAPRTTMRWDPVPATRHGGASAPEPAAGQTAARQRFDAAVAACGPGLRDVLWRVVCMGEGLGTAEQALGWPVRAGKLVLTLALDRLVGHYGLEIAE